MRSLLAAALLLSATAHAAQPPKPKAKPAASEASKLECPDGRAPILTGRPFAPLACPPGGKEPPQAELKISTDMAPTGSRGGSLAALDGRWEGLVYFGARRFECVLTVSDGGTRGVWDAMDYASHLGHPLEGVLHKPGFFSRGVPRLDVTMPHLPGAKLSARVWLASGVAAWKYDGREELHRVEYKLDGDRLTGRYVLYAAPQGPVAAARFELTRRK